MHFAVCGTFQNDTHLAICTYKEEDLCANLMSAITFLQYCICFGHFPKWVPKPVNCIVKSC